MITILGIIFAKPEDRAGAFDWRARGTSLPKGPCVEVGRKANLDCTADQSIHWLGHQCGI